MPDRSRGRLPKIAEHAPDAFWPDAIDETVIHDPNGRPWLVCTTDLRWQHERVAMAYPEELDPETGPFETQVYYTARAGIRGFPTGHGQRYETRAEAVCGHREWCLRVRTGTVAPDLVPEEPV
jgi:hypothetical protein